MELDDILGVAKLTGMVLGFSGLIALPFTYVFSGVLHGREMRKSARRIAPYAGLVPDQMSPNSSYVLAETVFPKMQRGYKGGVVIVPVEIPDKSLLKTELEAYYRHPAGVGSEEALKFFFSQPAVANYLKQPKTLLERLIFA